MIEWKYRFPPGWWAQSSVLTGIRYFADARAVRPEGVYVALLSAASAHIPPGVQTPIGTEPNVFAGLVGASGSGKLSTMNAADLILAPPNQTGTGTLSWYAEHLLGEQGAGLPATAHIQLTHGFSIAHHLFHDGPRIRKQFRDLYAGKTISRPRGKQLTGGTYRVAVREGIYPSSAAWLTRPQFKAEFDRFVFGPGLGHFCGKPVDWVPKVELPADWLPGPQPMPPAADPDAEPTRFTVLSAHAALHGRSVPTDADWAATGPVMKASGWLKKWMKDRHGGEWRVRNGKPYRANR
jgi:hypothetical protein